MAFTLHQLVTYPIKTNQRFYSNYNVNQPKYKNAIVTGGSRGIGYIISENLAKKGMNVAGMDSKI